MLAVLGEPSAATEALAELGVSHARLTEHLRSQKHEPPPPPLDPTTAPLLNPAAYMLMGWAQGYATAAGLREPQPADWVLATVYRDAGGVVAPYLHSLGISASALVDALARRGVPTPPLEPPTYRPWRGHRTVEVAKAELEPVLALLHKRHPPGSEWRWGFNSLPNDPQRARLLTEDGIDLEAIVAEVRKRRLH